MADTLSFCMLFVLPVVLGYVIHLVTEDYSWEQWQEDMAEMGESTQRWLNGERY